MITSTVNKMAYGFCLVLALILFACESSTVVPTATPEASPTLTPTSTATLTPTPLPTHTRTPMPPTPTPVKLELEFLGVPGSYNSLKESHWPIIDLTAWHDRIYIAHGDYNDNTGPVRAIYFDSKSSSLVFDDNFSFDEEAIWRFRIYNDVLYVPGTDARQDHSFGNLYFKSWGSKWQKLRTIPKALHVMDVALIGKTLYVLGITDGNVFDIWVSRDNGLTFTPNKLPASTSIWSSFFVLKERLYVTAAYAYSLDARCLVLNNDVWDKIACTNARTVNRSANFKDTVVMSSYPYNLSGNPARWSSPSDSSYMLHLFNGKDAWAVKFDSLITDLIATDDYILVLGSNTSGDGRIFYTSKLNCYCEQDFTQIMSFDASEGKKPHASGNTPNSLEYVGGRFYVGFSDGRLFRSRPYIIGK